MIVIDKTLGPVEFVIDETGGLLTFEMKATVLGTPEDVKIPIDIRTLVTALEAGMTNSYVKWVLGLLLNLMP